MIKLEITCENVDEARLILNAQQYHSLICDFISQVKRSRECEEDINKVIDIFIGDFCIATEHHRGPY